MAAKPGHSTGASRVEALYGLCMPDSRWRTAGTPGQRGECTAFASKLVLRSDRNVPVLLDWAAQVTRRLQHVPGLLGYAIAPHPAARTLWTVSAWENRADLLDFERGHPHRTAKAQLRDLLAPSTLVVWTCATDQLPIGWHEVRARITAIDTTSPDHLNPPSTNG